MSLNKRGTSLCLSLLVASAIFLAALPIQSQDNKQSASSADQDEVIRITSNLVNLDVMVKDKKGKAITNLKAEDFVLTENGVRQNIEFFDTTLAGSNDPGQAANISVSKLPRNIISLVLDGQTTEGANLKHVRDGMTKYIRERISE